MIGQQAGALLVGDAKQRTFLRSSILVASSAAPFESLRILLEGGAVLFDSRARGVAVAPPFQSRRARR
jgi:hypothetical protein